MHCSILFLFVFLVCFFFLCMLIILGIQKNTVDGNLEKKIHKLREHVRITSY